MPKYLTKEQLGTYSVKNVKMHESREGYGFNCDLYREGKKLGHCYDDGNGGQMSPIDWINPPKTADDDAGWKKWHDFRAKEEALLDAHVATLPEVQSDIGDGRALTMDVAWFVDELINKFEEDKFEKKMRKTCQTKTVYSLKSQEDGRYWIVAVPYSPEQKTKLEAKYGDDIKEILNEKYV